LIGESQPLNEGVTEYFTRMVLAQIEPSLNRRNYQANYRCVQRLVGFTSEPIVAGAFFDGSIATLRNNFNIRCRADTAVEEGAGMSSMVAGALGSMADVAVGAVGGGTAWSVFCGECSANNWASAQAMLQ